MYYIMYIHRMRIIECFQFTVQKRRLSDCLEGNTVHGVIEKSPGQLDLLPQKVLADLQDAAHVPEGDHRALMALIPDVPGSRFFGGMSKNDWQ